MENPMHPTLPAPSKATNTWLNKNLSSLLTCILVVASISILIVVFLYVIHFSWGLSSKNEVWGQFGDYFGGTLNPILSFLALISLLITLWVQSQSLDVAQRQIAQQTEVASLSAQITAMGTLIESLNKQIEQDNKFTANGGYTHQEANRARLNRREELVKRLDDIYEKLVSVQAVR